MSEIREFEFFADPLNFTYLADTDTVCDFCQSSSICFDAQGYYGRAGVKAVCSSCLQQGRLETVGVTANVARALDDVAVSLDLVRSIEHCTPMLPTWQGSMWPCIQGKPARFLKIASRHDFASPGELLASIPENERLGQQASELWDMLPSRLFTYLADGNYDVSFYFFLAHTTKLCLWDAN